MELEPHTPQAGDPLFFRVGGGMAAGGALLEFVGNVMHPRSTEYYDDPVAWLDHNTESSIWFASHVLILLGAIVAVGGFVALSRSFAGTKGHGLGHLALASALVGSTLLILALVIDGLVVPAISDVWDADSPPSADAVLTGTIFYYTIFNLLYAFMLTLFGVAPILYGVAMLVSNTYKRWLGWVGVVVGSAVVVSALLSMVDIQRKVLDAIVWEVTSSMFVIWLLVLGVLLWRRGDGQKGDTAST